MAKDWIWRLFGICEGVLVETLAFRVNEAVKMVAW